MKFKKFFTKNDGCTTEHVEQLEEQQDLLTLNVTFPSGHQDLIRVPATFLYGSLRTLVATAAGLDQEYLGLFRQTRRHEWESIALLHNDVIVKTLCNFDHLRVIDVRKGHEAQLVVKDHGYPSAVITGCEGGEGGSQGRFPNHYEWEQGNASGSTRHGVASSQTTSWTDFGQSSHYPNRGGPNTDNDLEIARRLQEEFDQSHAIKTSSQQCNSGYPDPYAASSLPPTMVPTTQMTRFGQVISRGTKSQYDLPGGESICTSICVAAAHYWLSLIETEARPIASLFDADKLDDLLMQGAIRHESSMMAGQHSGIDDLWTTPVFADFAEDVERGLAFTGTSKKEDFVKSLRNAWKHANQCDGGRVAMVITKPPETILCFATIREEWYLLDSHGERDAATKRVYLMRFESVDALAAALECKFPGLPGADCRGDDWQTAMYNSFEATPLARKTLKPSKNVQRSPSSVSEFDDAQASVEKGYEKDDKMVILANAFPLDRADLAQAPPLPLGAAHPSKSDTTPVTKPPVPSSPNRRQRQSRETLGVDTSRRGFGVAERNELPVYKSTHAKLPDLPAKQPAIDKSNFHDPTMNFLMADPVVCEDGFTYDRTVIEKHFQTRREEEETRRQGRSNDGPQKDNGGSTNHKPIELTSPLSGEVISDILLPNRSLELQIVEAVETYAIDISDEERKSWGLRRAEKRKRDRERAERSRRQLQEAKAAAEERERRAREEAVEQERRARAEEEEERKRLEAMVPPQTPKKDPGPYLDPLLCTLMADPVVCDDGNTYDRSVIEQHFESRRQEEEARQRAEQCEEENTENEGATTCCNAQRHQIDLTSPLSGEVVSDRLTPNRALEQQIVEHMENDDLDVSEEDRKDWQERREEKRRNDRERQEQRRRRQEEEERMRQAAEEAEERRRQEAEQGITSGTDLATIVRAIPSNQTQNHLGVAVSLCDEAAFIPLDYAVSSDRPLRCMVACCSSHIDPSDPSWCQRCGRIACDLCLSFRVSDIQQPQVSESSRICGECAMHIADIMPRNGQLGQARAYVLRLRLAPYTEMLTKNAVDVQDAQTRVTVARDFEGAIRQLHTDIRELQQQRSNTQSQIRAAQRQAERSKQDEGTSDLGTDEDTFEDGDIEDLEARVAELSQQYQDLLEKDVSDEDEDAQMQHMTAVSELSQRLEQVQVSVMMARSTSSVFTAPSAAAAATSMLVDETQALSSMNYTELEALCSRLEEQYIDICQQDVPDDEDAQLQHMLEITSISNHLEEAQVQLVQANSMGGAGTTSPSTDSMDTNQLQQLYQSLQAEYNSLTTSDSRPTDEGEQIAYATRVSDLAQQIESIELQIMSGGGGNNDQQATPDLGPLSQSVTQLIKEVEKERSRPVVSLFGRRNRSSAINDALREALQALSEGGGVTRQDADSFIAVVQDVNTKRSKVRVNQLKIQIIRQIDSLVSNVTQRQFGGTPVVGTVPNTATAPSASPDSTVPNTATPEPVSPGQIDEGLLQAIGNRDEDWPLPLGLEYPTTRMTNQLEMLRNALEQSLVESQRRYDEIHTAQQQELQQQKDQLEDEVVTLRQQASDAQAAAEEEQQRLEERRERARRQEEERRERERERRERERRAREEAEQLRQRNEADEQATRNALASAAAQREGGASAFGGRGDLRMCRRCKAGPVENQACRDLQTHNNDRGDVRNANHCRHCGWFNSEWRQWLVWDGVFGPH